MLVGCRVAFFGLDFFSVLGEVVVTPVNPRDPLHHPEGGKRTATSSIGDRALRARFELHGVQVRNVDSVVLFVGFRTLMSKQIISTDDPTRGSESCD